MQNTIVILQFDSTWSIIKEFYYNKSAYHTKRTGYDLSNGINFFFLTKQHSPHDACAGTYRQVVPPLLYS